MGRGIDLKLRGTSYKVLVLRLGPHRFRVTISAGETRHVVDTELSRIDEFHNLMTIAGQRYRLVTATHGPVQLVEVDGVTHRVTRDEGGMLRSPAPALVVATPVAVGDTVAAGAHVLVLESMKMETVLQAPVAGRVRELLVKTGSQVETGAPLLRIEPEAEEEDAQAAGGTQAGPDLELPEAEPEASAEHRVSEGLAALRAIMLGYDADPDSEAQTLAGYLAAREEARAAGQDVVTGEIELLCLFAELAELSRNRPGGEEQHTELRVHSAREHFHTYLQSLDVERHGLNEHFRDRLTAVLARYGVTELDRTPELEEAVFRIYLAQRRSGADVQLVTSVLQRWIAEPPPEESSADQVRQVLERMVRATQLRFPIVGDLARSIRFRWFDQPLVDQERSSVLAGVQGELVELSDDAAPNRAERVDALAAIPEQIVRFLAERLEQGISGREPMLEVLVRRHYREHDLHDLQVLDVAGRPFVVADYVLDENRPTRLVTTVGTFAEVGDPTGALATAVGEQVAARPSGSEAVVDLYLSWPDAPGHAGGGQCPARRAAGVAAVRLGRTPHRGRGHPRRRRAGGLLHVPAGHPGRRGHGHGGGRPRPWHPPDGGSPAEPLAAAGLQGHPARGAGGRAALPLRGQRQPGRPAARRARAGASARGGP